MHNNINNFIQGGLNTSNWISIGIYKILMDKAA